MKTKKFLGVLLTIIMLMSLVPTLIVVANAEEEGYLEVFYFKPPQMVNDTIAMDSTSYLEVTYYTPLETLNSIRMVNVGNDIYGAVIRQTVITLELRLKSADGLDLWSYAFAPSGVSGYNMAYYSEEQDGVVWDAYGTQIGSQTVPGVLYFTPNQVWAAEGSRFSVSFISSGNAKTNVELVPLGDGTFAALDMDCAKYQFHILREQATSLNQTLYSSAQFTKKEEENNHCMLIENGALAGANGLWEKREVIEDSNNYVSIYFNSNGGTGQMSGRKHPINSEYVLPYCAYIPPLGMTFKAWEVNGIEYQERESIYLNLNEYVINAVWKEAISVTYTANGGEGDDITVYIPDAGMVTLPENTFTAPDEKNFKAWDVNGTEYPPGKQVSILENTVIKAVWRDGYTITYDPNGGNGTKRVMSYGLLAEITLEQNKFSHPEKYSFLGWEINGELYSPGDSYVIESNVIAYAKWNKTFTVEYIFVSPASNEHKFTDNVTEGETYTIKSPYELQGITFGDRYEISGWRNGDVLYEGGQELSITESITLTLDYKYKLYRTFYYDDNYEEEIQYIVYKDEEFIIPECTFTPPEGYMLEYWQDGTDINKKYYPGDKYEPNTSYSDGTFYAVWIEATELGSLDEKIKDGIFAGIEYALPSKTRKLSDKSFADVKWVVKEKGTTGASISADNVLTAQKSGSAVISVRVSGAMADGSDFYKEYEVAVCADYQIRTADELFDFAKKVNSGYSYINAVLMNDIDLKDRPWTPIGLTGESNSNFRGIFDGQNHTITGLYVEGGGAGLGFFGEVGTGTVKNFTIYGNVAANTEGNYVGGVIGSVCGLNSDNDLERNGAVIQNITSYVNLTAETHGIGMIGGFVGCANHGSLIENCSWYGTFDAGIYHVDPGAGGFIGKIQEYSGEVTIRNCAAYGTIKTNYAGDYNNTATIYIGGFLGLSDTKAMASLENSLFAGKFERGENLTSEARLGAFGTLTSVNSVKNCYYLGDDGLSAVHSESYLTTESENVDITKVTAQQLESGEVAYLLGDAFGQTINTDKFPILNDNKVYKYTEGYSNELKFGFADYKAGGAKINIPTAGEYSLIFADYEGGKLNAFDIVEVTVTADKVGEITKASEKGVNISTGDKIILWQTMISLEPLCKAFIVE